MTWKRVLACMLAAVLLFSAVSVGSVQATQGQHVEDPAAGHSFGLWTIDTEPSGGKGIGKMHRQCSCGYTEEAEYDFTLTDVPSGRYFSRPVFWAYVNNITQGKTKTEFQKDAPCTRGQIVMFLWRAAGEPEPETKESPFPDVTPGNTFYKAIMWAVENKITSGQRDGTFGIKVPCNRQQTVMFLWRYFNKVEPEMTDSPFSDVTAGSSFAKAIFWAVEQEITSGTGDGTTFSPENECTRGQIVTFLFRAIAQAKDDTEEEQPSEPEQPTVPTEPEQPTVPTEPEQPTDGETYTYNTVMSSLPTSWNPHTYEMSISGEVLDYLTDSFYGLDYNADRSGYELVPRMAVGDPEDITAQYIGRYGVMAGEVNKVYKITLRRDLKWQDGTPITAHDFVESAKRLLNPNAQNYRAEELYGSSYTIVNAKEYMLQGATNMVDNGKEQTYQVADLVKGENGVYETPTGEAVWIAVDYPLQWTSGYTLKTYVDAYGETYFGMETYGELCARMNDRGLVPCTEENLTLLAGVTTTNPAWNETEADLFNYLVYVKSYPAMDFSEVGIFALSDYELVYALSYPVAPGYQMKIELPSNYLVHLSTYDACTSYPDGVYSNTYGTSLETTWSYGPYKLTAYEAEKEILLERNAQYYGLGEGKYQTTHVSIQYVAKQETQRELFMAGKLDSYSIQTSDDVSWWKSENCYYTPGQGVYSMILNGHMEAITERENAEGFDQSAQDLQVLTLTSFRRAMGLAFDKKQFCQEVQLGSSPAYGLLSDAFIWDVNTGVPYRDTDEAKQVLLDVYQVDASKFASIDEAVASITGYSLEGAREWFRTAFAEGIAAGYITDADNDGKCDQRVTMLYNISGSLSEKQQRTITWMNQQLAVATEGTPFAGKLEIVPSEPQGYGWAGAVKNGETDLILAGWSGSAMNPYGYMDVYTNPNNQFDVNWWDSTSVSMTLEVPVQGELRSVTLNLRQWVQALNGFVFAVDGVNYSFGEDAADQEVRLKILASVEKEILMVYNYLPFDTSASAHMKSLQINYGTEKYVNGMGFGGLRYYTYNYSDAQWENYIASQGGQLDYT